MKIRKVLAILISIVLLASCAEKPSTSKPDFTSVPKASSEVNPIIKSAATDGYKAMWISYLEWENFDKSSEAAFTKSVAEVYDNCKKLGINTVIVHVRPFADAIYKSALFPWSHIITGTQGQDPLYDPFAVLVKEAHSRELKIEAWINPYRVRFSDTMPTSELAANNPGVLHPELVKSAAGGLFFNPASKEVQKLIVDGIKEVATNYDIDGVHFDDYFYPETDTAFDSEDYKASGTTLSLADWRRENVNTLIKACYSAIKEIDPNLPFGISPQGNNDNNYNQQYSDVGLWLSTPGYVDYITPQIYWGFNYITKAGRKDYEFVKLCNDFAAMPRHSSVKLYIGLGAYRIGVGDSGAGDQAEWQTGHNIADMITATKEINGISGWTIYNYKSLYFNQEYSELAKAEVEAITKVNAQ